MSGIASTASARQAGGADSPTSRLVFVLEVSCALAYLLSTMAKPLFDIGVGSALLQKLARAHPSLMLSHGWGRFD